MIWFDWILLGASIAMLVPVCILAVEILCSLLPSKTKDDSLYRFASKPCWILMPAHNEELVIEQTLLRLKPHLRPEDSVLVVADNCTDRTAEIVRSHGHHVLERSHATDRGKGFALAAGVEWLTNKGPEIVVVMDADCELLQDGLQQLLLQVTEQNRPAQAIYWMELPRGKTSVKQQISAFAFRVKNEARPKGLSRLGMPILLTGTGMAFPWRDIATMKLASGNIVEDMQLGVDLAIAGHPVALCEQARVISRLPEEGASSLKQRKRWEHGHVRTIRTQVPRLLGAFCRSGRIGCFALAADLTIPPLAFLVLLWLLLTTTCVLWNTVLLGSRTPIQVCTIGGGLLLSSILVAWWKYGRDLLSWQSLLLVPLYVAWKIPIYVGLIFSPQRSWNRTDRNSSS